MGAEVVDGADAEPGERSRVEAVELAEVVENDRGGLDARAPRRPSGGRRSRRFGRERWWCRCPWRRGAGVPRGPAQRRAHHRRPRDLGDLGRDPSRGATSTTPRTRQRPSLELAAHRLDVDARLREARQGGGARHRMAVSSSPNGRGRRRRGASPRIVLTVRRARPARRARQTRPDPWSGAGEEEALRSGTLVESRCQRSVAKSGGTPRRPATHREPELSRSSGGTPATAPSQG